MGEKVVFTEACREEMIVPILSTGQESTVANWIALSNVVFGRDSKQVDFLKNLAPVIKPEQITFTEDYDE